MDKTHYILHMADNKLFESRTDSARGLHSHSLFHWCQDGLRMGVGTVFQTLMLLFQLDGVQGATVRPELSTYDLCCFWVLALGQATFQPIISSASII